MIFITMILVSCIFISLFPTLISPVSLGGLLIFISVSFVVLISLMSSAWYGYLLFLIYIGGLLVLFIYMCMISSNTMFKFEAPQVLLLLFTLLFFLSLFDNNYMFLGASAYDSGTSMKMSVFLSLVIVLLVMFLAVVQIIKIKSPLQIESK